jgi:hypothetical protein
MDLGEPVTRHKQSLQIILLIGSRERSVYSSANFMYLTVGTMLILVLTVQFLSLLSCSSFPEKKASKNG